MTLWGAKTPSVSGELLLWVIVLETVEGGFLSPPA
jgi:hypothetical protein